MADLDTALAAALAHHDPAWNAPDTSAWMQRQRAELTDWDEPDDDADDEEDFAVDDVHIVEAATGWGG